MRIIAGEWRGRKIGEPRGRDVTRPTTDRAREACASMVNSALAEGIEGARVLDAFAGSGALGLEMLSRGAAFCAFWDVDRGAAALVRKNIAALGCAPVRARVQCGDVLAAAERGRIAGGPFDVVLLDPPYALGAEPVERLLGELARHGLLASGAIALFEHAAADAGARPAGFSVEREKRYGIAAVDLLRFAGADAESAVSSEG